MKFDRCYTFQKTTLFINNFQALEEERIQDQNEKIERLKFMQRLDAQMEQKVFIAKLYYLELILSNLFTL